MTSPHISKRGEAIPQQRIPRYPAKKPSASGNDGGWPQSARVVNPSPAEVLKYNSRGPARSVITYMS